MGFSNWLGVLDADTYWAIGERRKYLGVRVAYSLLDVGDELTPRTVKVFEDICFTLRLANGTFRTSFRNRFDDLNQVVERVLRQQFGEGTRLAVQDRAVSHALTSVEWAQSLFGCFPEAVFEASDLLLHLVELRLPDGSRFVAEPDGTVLQAIHAPFVVSMAHPEGRRFPLHGLVRRREQRRLHALALPEGWTEGIDRAGYAVRPLSLVHPEARRMARDDHRFVVTKRSVFDVTPHACDVLRTVNILNRGYFSDAQLGEGIRAVWASLRPEGIWVVGRTTEGDFRNNASIFKRTDSGWSLVERFGEGSEIEELALSWSFQR